MTQNEKKQGNIFIFVFTLVSLGFQTVLTFVLLSRSARNTTIGKITTALFIIYIIFFAIFTLASLGTRKYSKTALGLYKNSLKTIKYALKLLLIAISILNIISASRLDLVALISSIFSLFLIIITISFDVLVAELKFKYFRYRKRKKQQKLQRQKEEAERPNDLRWLDDFRERKNAEVDPKPLDLFATNEADPFPDAPKDAPQNNGGTNGKGYLEE